MKVLGAYLGQAALGKFAHGTQTGVCGFKPNMQPEGSFGPGDILLFASGYTGNIRLLEEQWLPDRVTMVATAQIETPLSSSGEATFHWPDEIAMLGRSGLDINDPAKKHSLRSLPGSFSGLQLVSLMYTGMKLVDLTADAGIDLSQEFAAAKSLLETPEGSNE